MGLFFRLFRLFNKNKPHKELLEHYYQLHLLSDSLQGSLGFLRKLQKEMAVPAGRKSSARTGSIALEKTMMVDEELLKKMKKIAIESKARFESASQQLHATEPLSPIELAEIQQVTELLKKVEIEIPDVEKISSIASRSQRLILVETALRNICRAIEDFHSAQKYEGAFIKKVYESQVSPLLRKIYEHPESAEFKDTTMPLLTYTITQRQLRQLEKESKKINLKGDPGYNVAWRRWWRERQRPETDAATPLKEAHINVTLKLFGGPKKDIHLLVR